VVAASAAIAAFVEIVDSAIADFGAIVGGAVVVNTAADAITDVDPA